MVEQIPYPRLLPVEHPSHRRHREPRRVVGASRRLLTLDEECELLSQKEILRGESTLRTDEIPSERDGVEDNGYNIREQSQERAFPCSELTTVTSSGGRETADPGTFKPRNQRRIEFLRGTGVARSSLGKPSRAPRDSNGDITPAAPACSCIASVPYTALNVAANRLRAGSSDPVPERPHRREHGW